MLKRNLKNWKKASKESRRVDRNDETKFMLFSKIQLEWLEEELQEALSEENYQWAKNVKKEIERVKKEEDK